MRDWLTLYTNGLPLYEKPLPVKISEEPTVEEVIEQERQDILDEADFQEYRVTPLPSLLIRNKIRFFSLDFLRRMESSRRSRSVWTA